MPKSRKCKSEGSISDLKSNEEFEDALAVKRKIFDELKKIVVVTKEKNKIIDESEREEGDLKFQKCSTSRYSWNKRENASFILSDNKSQPTLSISDSFDSSIISPPIQDVVKKNKNYSALDKLQKAQKILDPVMNQIILNASKLTLREIKEFRKNNHPLCHISTKQLRDISNVIDTFLEIVDDLPIESSHSSLYQFNEVIVNTLCIVNRDANIKEVDLDQKVFVDRFILKELLQLYEVLGCTISMIQEADQKVAEPSTSAEFNKKLCSASKASLGHKKKKPSTHKEKKKSRSSKGCEVKSLDKECKGVEITKIKKGSIRSDDIDPECKIVKCTSKKKGSSPKLDKECEIPPKRKICLKRFNRKEQKVEKKRSKEISRKINQTCFEFNIDGRPVQVTMDKDTKKYLIKSIQKQHPFNIDAFENQKEEEEDDRTQMEINNKKIEEATSTVNFALKPEPNPSFLRPYPSSYNPAPSPSKPKTSCVTLGKGCICKDNPPRKIYGRSETELPNVKSTIRSDTTPVQTRSPYCSRGTLKTGPKMTNKGSSAIISKYQQSKLIQTDSADCNFSDSDFAALKVSGKTSLTCYPLRRTLAKSMEEQQDERQSFNKFYSPLSSRELNRPYKYKKYFEETENYSIRCRAAEKDLSFTKGGKKYDIYTVLNANSRTCCQCQKKKLKGIKGDDKIETEKDITRDKSTEVKRKKSNGSQTSNPAVSSIAVNKSALKTIKPTSFASNVHQGKEIKKGSASVVFLDEKNGSYSKSCQTINWEWRKNDDTLPEKNSTSQNQQTKSNLEQDVQVIDTSKNEGIDQDFMEFSQNMPSVRGIRKATCCCDCKQEKSTQVDRELRPDQICCCKEASDEEAKCESFGIQVGGDMCRKGNLDNYEIDQIPAQGKSSFFYRDQQENNEILEISVSNSSFKFPSRHNNEQRDCECRCKQNENIFENDSARSQDAQVPDESLSSKISDIKTEGSVTDLFEPSTSETFKSKSKKKELMVIKIVIPQDAADIIEEKCIENATDSNDSFAVSVEIVSSFTTCAKIACSQTNFDSNVRMKKKRNRQIQKSKRYNQKNRMKLPEMEKPFYHYDSPNIFLAETGTERSVPLKKKITTETTLKDEILETICKLLFDSQIENKNKECEIEEEGSVKFSEEIQCPSHHELSEGNNKITYKCNVINSRMSDPSFIERTFDQDMICQLGEILKVKSTKLSKIGKNELDLSLILSFHTKNNNKMSDKSSVSCMTENNENDLSKRANSSKIMRNILRKHSFHSLLINPLVTNSISTRRKV